MIKKQDSNFAVLLHLDFGKKLLFDKASAQNDVAIVDDARLPGSRSALRRVEQDMGAAIRQQGDDGRRIGSAGAHLNLCARRLMQGKQRVWLDDAIAQQHPLCVLLAGAGKIDAVALRVDGADKDRIPQGDTQMLALTDGVMQKPFVLSADRAVGRDELTGRTTAQLLLDEGGVVPVGQPADFLAVGSIGAGKTQLMCNLTHLCFFQTLQRQQQHRQLLLGQTIEHIGLVALQAVGFSQHSGAVGLLLDPGVVTGRNEIKSQLRRSFADEGKFGGRVAQDAGVGGASLPIFPAEGQDDVFLKLPMTLDDVQRHLHLFCDDSCGLDRCPVRRRKFQNDPFDLIALLTQQMNSDRGIDPSADRCQYPLSGHGKPLGRSAHRRMGSGRCRCGGSSRQSRA